MFDAIHHIQYIPYNIQLFLCDWWIVSFTIVTKLWKIANLITRRQHELLILLPKYAYSTAWNIWIIIDYFCKASDPLRWRHNGCVSVSNHQPPDSLLNRLFRRRSKKTSKLRVTGLCAGNSPVTGEFPAQMASNAEKIPLDDVIM